jgi:hypothetical protein
VIVLLPREPREVVNDHKVDPALMRDAMPICRVVEKNVRLSFSVPIHQQW